MIGGWGLIVALAMFITGLAVGGVASGILILLAVVVFLISLGGNPQGYNKCLRCNAALKRYREKGRPSIVFDGKFKSKCPICGHIFDCDMT